MIIKCPECGHQISDKAPVCPSCGVEIAGKIVRCPNCGEIHFISDGICPNCHHSLLATGNGSKRPATHEQAPADSNEDALTEEQAIAEEENEIAEEAKRQKAQEVSAEPVMPGDSADEEPINAVPLAKASTGDNESVRPLTDNDMAEAHPLDSNKAGDGLKKPTGTSKVNRRPLIISLIVAAVICLVVLFLYSNAKQDNENSEYLQAIESRDPNILKSYLDTYSDAPQEHRDSVMALLNAIAASDPEWEKVKSSNDANALRQYLAQNPKSEHRQEAMGMIDELDWKAALQTHDFANYLALHQNGRHAPEAVDSVKMTMDMPASGDDKRKAVSAIRSFLVAINAHNADRVKNCFASHLEYFNEKSSVDNSEAVNYMAIIYKNAERLNWHVDDADAAKVTKVGNGASAKYSLTMPARLSVNYTSGNNVQAGYNIQAKIDGSGHITAIRLIKQADGVSAIEKKPAATEKKSESEEKKPAKDVKKSSTTEKKTTATNKKKSKSDTKSSGKKK